MINNLILADTALKLAWPWYVVRASGVVALALLLLVTISGIGMVTGLTYRFIEPLKAWTIHRAMAIALAVSTLVHMGFLLIDKFAPYSFANILIPFSVRYEHSHLFGISVGSLYNAMGIIAAYLLAIVLISSLFIIDTKKKFWQWLHYLSYPLMVLVFFHALFLGTDFKHGAVRILWTLFGLVLLAALISRLRRAGTLHKAETKS